MISPATPTPSSPESDPPPENAARGKSLGKGIASAGVILALLAIAALSFWRLSQPANTIGINTSVAAIALLVTIVAGIITALAGVAVFMFASVPRRK